MKAFTSFGRSHKAQCAALTSRLVKFVTYFSIPADISGFRTLSLVACMNRQGISIFAFFSWSSSSQFAWRVRYQLRGPCRPFREYSPAYQSISLSESNFDCPTFGKLSKRTPFCGLNVTSPLGVRLPYIPLRNCRMDSSELIRDSTSPLARCNWYPNCGAGPFTSCSVDMYRLVGGAYGVHTAKRWLIKSG